MEVYSLKYVYNLPLVSLECLDSKLLHYTKMIDM